jgi:hypothetical protein
MNMPCRVREPSPDPRNFDGVWRNGNACFRSDRHVQQDAFNAAAQGDGSARQVTLRDGTPFINASRLHPH